MKVDFDLKTADGKTADAMAKAIEARRKELGVTTGNACIALMLNVLKSLKADTRIADEKRSDIRVANADSKYCPSWKRTGGGKARRILRSGKDGCEVKPEKVVWQCGKYHKGEECHAYEVKDIVSDGKSLDYIIVCGGETEARKLAEAFHARKVRQSKGLARFALGLAGQQVYQSGNAEAVAVSDRARQTGLRNVETRVSDSGFATGDVSVEVHDRLDYAAIALHGSVDAAVQRAVAKMLGFLAHRTKDKGLHDSLKATIDELRKGAEA